jgi:hypothetical protein
MPKKPFVIQTFEFCYGYVKIKSMIGEGLRRDFVQHENYKKLFSSFKILNFSMITLTFDLYLEQVS